MQNLIIYDALSITSKIHQVSDIIELIGLKDVPWVQSTGAHGFKYRLYFECISIHFSYDDDLVWLEMTGQGCRSFETYGNGNYEAIFQLVKDNEGDMKITRLDIAFDDHTGLIDMNQLCEDARNQEYISRFEDWDVREGNKGKSVCHGSMKSEIFLRIYDKAAERGLKDDSHWIRIELQLRRERARKFIDSYVDIGTRFSGVLLNYVRYCDPNNDSNKWRWPLKPYWQRLVNDAEKISLYVKPGTEYNISHMDNFVFNQAGNAIAAEIEIKGITQFLKELSERDTRPNPKYDEIVKKNKKDRNNSIPLM